MTQCNTDQSPEILNKAIVIKAELVGDATTGVCFDARQASQVRHQIVEASREVLFLDTGVTCLLPIILGEGINNAFEHGVAGGEVKATCWVDKTSFLFEISNPSRGYKGEVLRPSQEEGRLHHNGRMLMNAIVEDMCSCGLKATCRYEYAQAENDIDNGRTTLILEVRK